MIINSLFVCTLVHKAPINVILKWWNSFQSWIVLFSNCEVWKVGSRDAFNRLCVNTLSWFPRFLTCSFIPWGFTIKLFPWYPSYCAHSLLIGWTVSRTTTYFFLLIPDTSVDAIALGARLLPPHHFFWLLMIVTLRKSWNQRCLWGTLAHFPLDKYFRVRKTWQVRNWRPVCYNHSSVRTLMTAEPDPFPNLPSVMKRREGLSLQHCLVSHVNTCMPPLWLADWICY